MRRPGQPRRPANRATQSLPNPPPRRPAKRSEKKGGPRWRSESEKAKAETDDNDKTKRQRYMRMREEREKNRQAKGTAKRAPREKNFRAPTKQARRTPLGPPKTVSPPPHTPKTKKLGLRLGPKPKLSPASQGARKRKQTDGYHTKILGDHFRRATHLTELIHPAAKTRRRSAPSIPNDGNETKEKGKQAQNKGPSPLPAPDAEARGEDGLDSDFSNCF